jgi:hypothetical protein
MRGYTDVLDFSHAFFNYLFMDRWGRFMEHYFPLVCFFSLLKGLLIFMCCWYIWTIDLVHTWNSNSCRWCIWKLESLAMVMWLEWHCIWECISPNLWILNLLSVMYNFFFASWLAETHLELYDSWLWHVTSLSVLLCYLRYLPCHVHFGIYWLCFYGKLDWDKLHHMLFSV